MIKKIIHISDVHIRTIHLHDLYKRQFDIFLSELRTKLSKYNHSEIRIVIAGDIFHSKINITNEQVMLAAWFFDALSQIGRVIIIPGNHDFLENNIERLDSITPIVDLLNDEDVVYYKNSGVYMDENINWVVYSLYQENKKPIFVKEDGLYVGLFHDPIQGMSTDFGFTFDDAYDKLNFYGCKIVLCGDIHKRQILYLESGSERTPIIQVGSFLQQDFGETIKHHGYGMYDIETNEYTFHDLPNEQPYLHFRINDITDIENGKEQLLNIG